MLSQHYSGILFSTIKMLQKHEQGTHRYAYSLSPTNIPLVISTWLKLQRGVLAPHVRTFFCVGKEFTQSHYCGADTLRGTTNGGRLSNLHWVGWIRLQLAQNQHWCRLWEWLRMSTLSRRQSSVMGSEGYFDWCESMERRQRENDRYMQSLIRQTRRLKEENQELRAQMSSTGPSQS